MLNKTIDRGKTAEEMTENKTIGILITDPTHIVYNFERKKHCNYFQRILARKTILSNVSPMSERSRCRHQTRGHLSTVWNQYRHKYIYTIHVGT